MRRRTPSQTAIETAANELAPRDIFFISYSGHGGQVPDGDDEEVDSSDETWLAYDRQLVDDELYAMWAKFKPGVRIVVLSDSCHSGTVNRGIVDKDAVPNVVRTAEEAAKHSPRFRALPLDKMLGTYRQNKDLYDGIQKQVAGSESAVSELGATVLLISGCLDDTALQGRLQQRALYGGAQKGLGGWCLAGGLCRLPPSDRERDAGGPDAELQPRGRR